MDRRSVLIQLALGMLVGTSVIPSGVPALSAGLGGDDTGGVPFSFDILSEAMRAKAAVAYKEPESALPEAFANLTYDQHRSIRYRPEHAVWKGRSSFELQAFHLGWLFKHPVRLFAVAAGHARPLSFAQRDFEYHAPLDPGQLEGAEFPGIAGFRLHYRLNSADILDELVAFLGASYYRALGRNTQYGLSARGLAVNTATARGEEFPYFTDFYLEVPGEHSEEMAVFAALDSPSLTGAYAFRVIPGQHTLIDVTARLFVRSDIERLGVAPMTSMFLFGENNSKAFDDYRDEVHDSDGLKIVRRNGEELWRSLNNPRHLANSFFSEHSLRGFGLFQRDRRFESYQDGGVRYERRPSLMIEPLNEWGRGHVHLVEIPSNLEINDNIVAYWVPEAEVTAGQELELRYRQTWGAIDEPTDQLARVVGLRTGTGGVSGVPDKGDGIRKFVVDFDGEALRHAGANDGIEARVAASAAKVVHVAASQLEATGAWRVAIDIVPSDETPVELQAFLKRGDTRVSETWAYQWRRDDGKAA